MRQFVCSLSCILLLQATPAMAETEETSTILEEIIVTAQKREQRLLDVPVAVSALDVQAFQDFDVSNLLDLSRFSPSVSLTPQQSKMSNNPLRIRGVGASGTNPAFEGSVGIYVDGVYRSRAGMVLPNLNDIESLEILRGPQGTLFGKNTSAGAIMLWSKAPSDSLSMGASLETGNYNHTRVNGHISGPLTPDVALRFAALMEQRDGFIESADTGVDYGDADTLSFKIQAAYDAYETFSARVIVDYTETDEQCCFGNTVRITDDALDALLYEPLANSVGLGIVNPANPYAYQNTVNRLARDVAEDSGIVLDMQWEFENSNLRSISSYRNWEYEQPFGDADFGPVDLLDLSEDYVIKTLAQEFNWSGTVTDRGPMQSIDYVLGAYFSSEEIEYGRILREGIHSVTNWVTLYDVILGAANFTDPSQPDFLPPQILATPGVDVYNGVFDHDDDVVAAFGHATFNLNDNWSLVAGLRYSHEEKRAVHRTLSRSDPLTESFGFFLLGASTGGRDFDETNTDSTWTGNVALQYFTDSGNMFYGGYSRGYKAGGISLNNDAGGMVPAALAPGGFTPIADPRYDPEYVDAVEFGFKGLQFDGRSRTSIALFHQDYSDIQFQLFTGTAFVVFNASDAVSQGIEIENIFHISDYLYSNLALTWLDASYGSGEDAPGNLRGRKLDHAPSLAGSLSLVYDRPLQSSSLAVFGNLNWSYMGRHFTDTATAVQTDAFNVLNLRAGLRSEDDSWQVSLWCRNCTEAEYIISSFNQPFYFGGAEAAYIGAPRTYGISLSYAY